MNKKELEKLFPFILMGELSYELCHNEYKTERGFLNHLKKVDEENERKATVPDVEHIRINIEWHKSYMWGNNPVAEYWCMFKDGSMEHGKETCSGCGYDKESTVIAAIMNKVCCGMLWRARNKRSEAPYGIYHAGKGKDRNWFPRFDGGIGTSCYYHIVEWLGGKMKNTASGRIFDAYEITFK